MFLKILNADEVKSCLNRLDVSDKASGKNTQPNVNIKQNTEYLSVPDEVRRIISFKIYDTHFIDSVYCPNRVSLNFYNKYIENDFYSTHVDNFRAVPKSNNVYFDYGFSINLHDDYEGGEMYFITPEGRISKKLDAGEMAIFPIIYPHGVEKITKGERVGLVGWISSNISYEKSFILRNLFEVSMSLDNNLNKDQELTAKANLVQNYLKKEWGK